MDFNARPGLLQRLAQLGNVRIERIGLDLIVEAVHRGLQCRAGDRAPLAHRQCLQYQHLAPRQRQRLALHLCLQRFEVEFQPAQMQARCHHRRGPPRDSTDPRHQLLDRHRLHQVVVGTDIQALDLVRQPALGRQHDHRQVRAQRACGGDESHAIAIGQLTVQQHQLMHRLAQRNRGFGQAADHVGDHALPLQARLQGSGQIGIVFDQENAHQGLGYRKRCRS